MQQVVILRPRNADLFFENVAFLKQLIEFGGSMAELVNALFCGSRYLQFKSPNELFFTL
jgi:hypothetical protein